MTENEKINGWTFEETIKIAENLMETESNMFKWDVLRHLRDFAENYKDELEQHRAIGTIEEFKALKEKSMKKKPRFYAHNYYCTECGNLVGNNEFEWQRFLYCDKCGQKLDW